MRTVNQIISADIELKSGETRIVDGQLAMCITPFASYGGGSGALWAVENQCVQFTTEAHPTYLEGICRKVDPRSRTVAIEITRGPTWGTLAMGDTAILPITVIRRYHPAPQAGESLIFESQVMRSQILADHAFNKISQREIREALATEHSLVLSSLIGEPVHTALQEVCSNYLKLCEQVNVANGACARMPSTAITRQRRALRTVLAALASQVQAAAAAAA